MDTTQTSPELAIFVRNLTRLIRANRPMLLDDAVEELCDIGAARERVEAAAELIRQEMRNVAQAQEPKAVLLGGIESWYFGPTAEDPNWSSLKDLLTTNGWGDEQLRTLDQASTKVVAQLPNPAASDDYHCRGLVLGYVQSGKTSNFTAVIAKAADAGYRLIIVLSGMHDALRIQTQDRLDQQLLDLNTHLWNRLTAEGDFVPSHSIDAVLANEEQRYLAVVKKNGARLKALKNWLFGARPELLAKCPVLIIDDEADQATVNTGKPGDSPKAINNLIRSIVNGASKSAYVGYTATPFANVLIDPTDYEDLYPRDFIVNLPRPKGYFGAETIFGREPLPHETDSVGVEGHDLVRHIPDDELRLLRPVSAAQRASFAPQMTPSLRQALNYFLLSTTARKIRGTGNSHATALIHTSQHIDMHQSVAGLIEQYLNSVRIELSTGEGGLLDELEGQWTSETQRVGADEFGNPGISWSAVRTAIESTARSIVVITDNSQSAERLRFDDAAPRFIVAVGGNTLSRGLTLEGLSVSYFVRTASAYDTLLQMGRWFGYRRGYEDLTRVWLTSEMRDWFRHLATVEQEIRDEIDRYEAEHEKPSMVGVRIRTHPKMAVTAAAKMQRAKSAKVSYSGRRLQTIYFRHTDASWLTTNLDAARQLIDAANSYAHESKREGVHLFRSVDADIICRFLNDYQVVEKSRDIDAALITKYIAERNRDGELNYFTVAVMGRRPTKALGEIDLGLADPVGCINRAALLREGSSEFADIKSLMSPPDRIADLGSDAYLRLADKSTKMDQIIRLRNRPELGGYGDDSGMLLLYPVSKSSTPRQPPEEGAQVFYGKTRMDLNAVEHVIGMALVFPVTASASAAVSYITADVDSMLGVEVDGLDEADVAAELAELSAP